MLLHPCPCLLLRCDLRVAARSSDRLLAIYSAIAPPEPVALANAASAHAAAAAASGAASSTGVIAPLVGRPQTRSELLVQVASLVDLRLFARASQDGTLDVSRLRCDAPREVVRAVAEHVKFDLSQYEEE